MKKYLLFSLTMVLSLFFIAACGGSNHDQKEDMASTENHSNDMAGGYEGETMETAQNMEESDDGEMSDASSDRKIIRRGYVSLRVENADKAQVNIEKKVDKLSGYIVETNVYHNGDETVYGHMTVRIPEKHFQTFLTDIENEGTNVIERNVSGDDVTEEYVDLEARLKSKRVVEERLLTFMKEAERTEDLLQISSDLSTVQEEIEVLVGKTKYLENQVAYATVDIDLNEERIVMPGFDGKNLNTWEKTKQQFLKSINGLLSFGSGLIIFIVGNLPVIAIILLGGVGFYFIMKPRIRKKK